MFRLVVLLGAGLFLLLLIGGEDRGQMRQGLAEAAAEAARAAAVAEVASETATVADPAPEAEAEAVVAAVFVPAQPVVRPAPENLAPAPEAVALSPDPAEAPAAEGSEPESGRLRYVNTKSINVRQGPGKEFPVVDRLLSGEAVLVVEEQGSPEEGWSLIRIEGDGIEGYVATRLLSDAPG